MQREWSWRHSTSTDWRPALTSHHGKERRTTSLCLKAAGEPSSTLPCSVHVNCVVKQDKSLSVLMILTLAGWMCLGTWSHNMSMLTLHSQQMFKAALILIFVYTMGQMTTCNEKEVAHGDKSTENYHRFCSPLSFTEAFCIFMLIILVFATRNFADLV